MTSLRPSKSCYTEVGAWVKYVFYHQKRQALRRKGNNIWTWGLKDGVWPRCLWACREEEAWIRGHAVVSKLYSQIWAKSRYGEQLYLCTWHQIYHNCPQDDFSHGIIKCTVSGLFTVVAVCSDIIQCTLVSILVDRGGEMAWNLSVVFVCVFFLSENKKCFILGNTI